MAQQFSVGDGVRGVVWFFCLVFCGFVAQDAQAQTAYRWLSKDGQVHYSDQPPPTSSVKDLQIHKLSTGSVVSSGGGASDLKQAIKNAPLMLYTTEDCKDACQRAREFLNQRGVLYTEKVLRTSDDAAVFRQQTASSELRVPVLMLGRKVEKGFQEGAWRASLDEAGYSKHVVLTANPLRDGGIAK